MSKPVTAEALVATIEMTPGRHKNLAARERDAAWLRNICNGLDVALIGLDREGNVRFMNDAAVKLTRCTLAETSTSIPAWRAELHGLHATADAGRQAVWLHIGANDAIDVWIEKVALCDRGSLSMLWAR